MGFSLPTKPISRDPGGPILQLLAVAQQRLPQPTGRIWSGRRSLLSTVSGNRYTPQTAQTVAVSVPV